MSRLPRFYTILVGLLISFLLSPGFSTSQLIDSVSSEHVILRMPVGRESLGRDLISDFERCYAFMNRATKSSLPRKLAIIVNWDEPGSSYSRQNAVLTVGMNRPDPAVDLNALLMHNVGRAIARAALIELSQGAYREDTEFLFEGMSEILVHEFDHSSRSLEAAWAISQFLDEMKMLGFRIQRSWSTFAAGKRCLRNAAPGITFLTTFRELQDRERPIKLFEALRKTSLIKSLEDTFKAPMAELENTWLKRVREYQAGDEITISAEEAPQLLRTNFVPDSVPSGSSLEIQLFFKDSFNNLLPDGVFLRDERTQRVMQAAAPTEAGSTYFIVKMPIERDCAPGQYSYQVSAIDESGNLRRWTGSYTVSKP